MRSFLYLVYFFSFKCKPAFLQLVQIFTLPPSARVAHWRLGYFLVFPVGLNFVARTRLEYFPAMRDVLSQIKHAFAIYVFFAFYFSPHMLS